MAIEIDWFWNGEITLVKGLHVSEFTSCGKAGQVNPGSVVPVLMVITLFLDFAERSPSQSKERTLSDCERE